jgi:hypothetical protein
MLVAMTYSMEFLLAVTLGLSAGYAAFHMDQDGTGEATANPCCTYLEEEANDLIEQTETVRLTD